MARALVLALCVLGVPGTAFPQDAAELWKFAADADIGEHVLAPNGDVLVASEKSVTLISGSTGKVLWTRQDMFHKGLWNLRPAYPLIGRDDKYEYLSFLDRYVRLQSRAPGEGPLRKFGRGVKKVDERDDERLLLLHLDTGEDVFDSWAAGIKALRGTCLVNKGSLLVAWGGEERKPHTMVAFDLAASKIAWTGQLPPLIGTSCGALDDAGVWLVYGRTDKEQHRVAAVDVATGKVQWESADLMKYDEDSRLYRYADAAAVVLFADKLGAVSVDTRTGMTKWRNPLDKQSAWGTPVRRDAYLFFEVERSLIALDVDSGAIRWQSQKPFRIVDSMDNGLLVRSGGLHLIQHATGQPVWSGAPMTDTAQLIHNDRLLQMSGSALQSVDLATGNFRSVGTVEFQGKESPGSLELLDGLVVVSSSQNVAAFDESGRKYHEYYEAPGLSGTEQFLAIALSTGMTTLSYAAASQQASANARDVAFIRGGSGTGYALYRVYTPGVGLRYKSTASSARFAYMFTERPDASGRKGFSVVRLDKTTGRERGRVWSPERRPSLAADVQAGRLFVKTDDKGLTAYQFEHVE